MQLAAFLCEANYNNGVEHHHNQQSVPLGAPHIIVVAQRRRNGGCFQRVGNTRWLTLRLHQDIENSLLFSIGFTLACVGMLGALLGEWSGRVGR